MNILTKLSLTNLKKNRKRTIGTIVGIMLSTALICAVATMFASFQKTLVQSAIHQTGYYHLKVSNITEENLSELKNNRDIAEIKLMYNLGESLLPTKETTDFPYINVFALEDKSQLEQLAFYLKDGRLPETKEEILLDTKTLKDAHLKIGDTITLNLGTRVLQEDKTEILNEYNPYQEGKETIINPTTKTYKIVGSYENTSYQYTYLGITVKEKSPKINAFISLKNPKEYKKSIAEITSASITESDEELYFGKSQKYNQYSINHELLRWEVFAFSDSTISMLYTVISIVILIILITSIFCIRNSFAIATTEKMKMYGMLSSVGATKKQIKKNVITESLMLGCIGIPLGILSGIFAVFVVIQIVNAILNDILLNSSIQKIQFTIRVLPILLSILLGILTIYLSSISSARKASKVSPIENLRNNNEIKIKKEKLKTPKFIQKLFKTGGVLAYKNLKRSKKKYRTTVISITVSILIFISMNSFINNAFGITSQYYTDYKYNLIIENVTEKEVEQIKKLNNITSITSLYTGRKTGYYQIKDFSKINQSEPFLTISSDSWANLSIYALEKDDFLNYAKEIGLNPKTIKNKGILCDEYRYYNDSQMILKRRYTYQKNDVINGTLNEQELNIPIADISSKKPQGIENTFYSDGFLIVNKEDYQQIDFQPATITINSSNPENLEKEIKNLNSDIRVFNLDADAKKEKSIILVISIFLYGFITVITLIGVTNIFNTITANMELRQKDFAILKSIGMTKKEFNRMINLETLFYSLKSLFYGISLGLLASYFMHKGFSKKLETTFQVPQIPILLSILFVFILIYTIMTYSMKKISKENIIETIRKENI